MKKVLLVLSMLIFTAGVSFGQKQPHKHHKHHKHHKSMKNAGNKKMDKKMDKKEEKHM